MTLSRSEESILDMVAGALTSQPRQELKPRSDESSFGDVNRLTLVPIFGSATLYPIHALDVVREPAIMQIKSRLSAQRCIRDLQISHGRGIP